MLIFSDCNSLFKNMLPFTVTLLILGKHDLAISLGAVLNIGLHFLLILVLNKSFNKQN